MFSQFFPLLQIVAPIFVVIGAGYAMRKANVLSAEADRSLMRIVLNLLAPSLAFDSILGNEALTKPENFLIPPLLGFGSILLGIGVARVGSRIFQIQPETKRRTFNFTVCIQNYGYIPLPLCYQLLGKESVGVLFAFSVGVEMAFWTIALWQLSGRPTGDSWKRAINVPLIAVTSAIVLNALGCGRFLPEVAHTTLQMLGVCAVPMALLLSGAVLADHLNANSLKNSSRTIVSSLALRVAILPILILVAAKLLPINDTLKSILAIQAAMPAAIFPIILTKLHHGDVPVALQVVMGTSLVGLITIPLWLSFGLPWVLR